MLLGDSLYVGMSAEMGKCTLYKHIICYRLELGERSQSSKPMQGQQWVVTDFLTFSSLNRKNFKHVAKPFGAGRSKSKTY